MMPRLPRRFYRRAPRVVPGCATFLQGRAPGSFEATTTQAELTDRLEAPFSLWFDPLVRTGAHRFHEPVGALFSVGSRPAPFFCFDQSFQVDFRYQDPSSSVAFDVFARGRSNNAAANDLVTERSTSPIRRFEGEHDPGFGDSNRSFQLASIEPRLQFGDRQLALLPAIHTPRQRIIALLSLDGISGSKNPKASIQSSPRPCPGNVDLGDCRRKQCHRRRQCCVSFWNCINHLGCTPANHQLKHNNSNAEDQQKSARGNRRASFWCEVLTPSNIH